MSSRILVWLVQSILLFPPFPYAVGTRDQFLISKTSFPMVVNNTTGLQMGINRNRPHIFQSPLFQVGTDPVRQTIPGWNAALLMAHIKVSLSSGKSPDVLAE